MREVDRNLSNLRVLKRLTLLAKHRFLTRKKKRAINERELKMVVNNFFLTRFGIANSAV